MPSPSVPSFPKEVKLSDGTSVVLRPMARGDDTPLLEFFQRIPEGDRYYLKDNVTSAKVIKGWTESLDYDKVLPLLALKGDRVVGDGSLHFGYGARRHQAEVRIAVDPEYRNRGLGRVMMRELVQVARRKGLQRLIMEVVPPREEAAVRATALMGFTPMVVLPDFAIDRSGLLALDMIILKLDLEDAYN